MVDRITLLTAALCFTPIGIQDGGPRFPEFPALSGPA